MSNSSWRGLVNTVGSMLCKHSPKILLGLGISGMFASTVLAVRATPKALELIKKKKEQRHAEKLTPLETVKTAGFCYIPAAVTSLLSASCLIGGSSVNGRRNAALAAAYSLSETALREYREKVVEVVGERKEQHIRDEVAKERIANAPVSAQEIIITSKGDTLCYDSVSGRYFKSDIDKLKKVENEINRRMISEMYISLNEFYDEIGSPNLGHIPVGNDLGWNVEKGFVDLSFSAQLTDDGTPCLVLDYRVTPQYNYS